MLNVAQAEAPVAPIEEQYPTDLEPFKYYAYDLVTSTWSQDQWEYFDDLITRESNWRSNAQNPTSTAFGAGQFLNSTWGLVGCEKTAILDEQITCTVAYVDKVYGSPKQAIIHHNAKNYY